jgi:GNAT superfamily N-acetyltransferase
MSSVLIRKFNPEIDSGFIYSTWPKGIYFGCEIKEQRHKWFSDFYKRMKPTLAHADVFIAHMNDDESFILGYSIVIANALEFLYVKKDYRNQGIGRLLYKHRPVDIFPVITTIGKDILRKHPELFNKGEPVGNSKDTRENPAAQTL